MTIRLSLFSQMRLLWILVPVICISGCNSDGGSHPASGGASAPQKWTAYERAETHPGIAKITGLKIPMRDGINLSASVLLPAGASGMPATGPFPVILTQTGYNKSVPLLRTSNEYFVHRGYAHLSVDVRGTGLSEGQWQAFSQTEKDDYLEVLDWAVAQPWSDGRIGTWGASFAAITQLYTAAHQHPAHKAIFAIVPMGDAYRDIVFTGGQINAGFIPVWMGLVTVLGLVPAEPDPALIQVFTQHILGALTEFQVPTIATAALGASGRNYDGEFWRERSPLEYADRIRTPTFIVGGLNDLFQRGQPLLYEKLSKNTIAKLLIGPWMHVAGSSGEGLPDGDIPSLDDIALMWFDHFLLGEDNGAASIPNVTQYLYGEERYVTSSDWPHPQLSAQRWYLRADGSLTEETPGEDEGSNVMLQHAVNGVCSTSSAQWTAGILLNVPLPCFTDNRLNELLELTYTTAPMEEPLYINGPIQADVWISSTARDASLVVRVTDVSPGGVSREITNGILTASLRAIDAERSRYIDGEMIQPWHPFTAESQMSLQRGEIVKVSVEVFPTSLVIQPGHSLRISIGPSDFPHGVPPLQDSLDQLAGVMTIHSDAEHPSSVVLPVVPASVLTSGDF